jgi:type IV secretory pathway VirB10-like protein
MFSNRLAIAGLAAACIIAAGAGGYLASRQHATTPVAVSAAAPAPATDTAATVASAQHPVQETEAVVGDTPVKPAPSVAAPVTHAPAAPVKRSETPASARTRSAKAATTPAAAPPPPLAQTWPSSASSTPSTPSSNESSGSQTRTDEHSASSEPPRAPDPPAKHFEELVVSADSVIGLKTETAISSDLAKVEDTVQARVSRDVRVGDKVVIPEGTRAVGSVVQVERGGKFKERARLGIRFHTLVLADGTRVPISTDTLYREGDAPTSAQKIGGGAVIGTILGAIVGGGKGAAIGGAAGAGAGTAATMAGDRSTATFPAGSPMTVRILSPVTITVEEK